MSAPTRIEAADLPTSARTIHKTVLSMDWLVQGWRGGWDEPPVLYLAQTDDHDAGTVRYPGYRATGFVVEGRHPGIPLGFRAHYLHKGYEDGRKTSAGAFDHAIVVDPIGLWHPFRATYRPIPTTQGKGEMATSYNRRLRAAEGMAAEQDRDYNDDEAYLVNHHHFSTALDFKAWLTEWKNINA